MNRTYLYEVYFGTNIPGSELIVPKQLFKKYVQKHPQIRGYSLSEIDGYWMGDEEITFKLSIASTNPQLAFNLAYFYKLTFNQDSVMVVMPDNECLFI